MNTRDVVEVYELGFQRPLSERTQWFEAGDPPPPDDPPEDSVWDWIKKLLGGI